MTLYQESKLACIQESGDQESLPIPSVSPISKQAVPLQGQQQPKQTQFSSSIRSDPLPVLLSSSPDSSSLTPRDSPLLQDNSKISLDEKIQQPQQHVTFNSNSNTNLNNHQNIKKENDMIKCNHEENNKKKNLIVKMTRSCSVNNIRQPPLQPSPSPSKNINNIQQANNNIFINTTTSNSNSNNNNNISKGHRAQLGVQEPPRPSTPILDFPIPEPEYFEDADTGRYGVRCICGKSHRDGVLVQCDKCTFWLHAICVCVASSGSGESSSSRNDPFFCPFCQRRAIRCRCGNNKRYEIPIVQCAQCKFWVHRQCENLKFGVIPQTFICSQCSQCSSCSSLLNKVSNHTSTSIATTTTTTTNFAPSIEFNLPLIKPDFKQIPNRASFVDCNRYEVIQSIPEGQFRNFVIADLNRTELHLHETVGRYFQAFAIPIFARAHDFWKCFIETLMTLLNCEKNVILTTLDAYANCFLYANINTNNISNNNSSISNNVSGISTLGNNVKPSKFQMGESIVPIIEQMELVSVDDSNPKKIYRAANGNICVSEACEDDCFICELPGFLLHTDEVYADEGIPLGCIRLYNSDLIIDLEGSSFQFAPEIARSFHFNSYVKLYESKSQGGQPRVGLFATRMKGPLQDLRRGTPVTADSQLFLPFDGEIPYNLPKCEWKSPRSKTKTKSGNNNINNNNYNNNFGNNINNSGGGNYFYNYGKNSTTYGGYGSYGSNTTGNGGGVNSGGNGRSISRAQLRKNENAMKSDSNVVNLSLLTAFCEDAVPPLPITLVNEREAVNRSHVNSMVRSRARASRSKNVEE